MRIMCADHAHMISCLLNQKKMIYMDGLISQRTIYIKT